MTIRKTFRRNLMTAAMLAVFSLAGVLNATADTDTYKDVKRPNGHARSMAAKQADIRACGAVNGFVSNKDFPKTDACMRAHGWVIARVDPDPATASSWDWGWSGTPSTFAGGFSSGAGSSDVSSSSASTSAYDPSADIAASNAANAAAQDMTNAAAAAATQTDVQFNTIYSVGN
jgi:hypothetical protein